MDYHSHRFEDHSLLIYKDNHLVALCPAHKTNSELKSHWGLTYGGILWGNDVNNLMVASILQSLTGHLKKKGFSEFKVKEIPEFYLNEQLRSFNVQLKHAAQVFHSEPVFAIDYKKPLAIHKTKLKHFRKGEQIGFEIECSSECTSFWNKVLIPRLKSRHDVAPVHSLDEISLLASRFPKEIKQYTIGVNGRMLAGITLFDKGTVVKSQYGATTDEGERLRALEYLFIHLIYKYKEEGKQFFSMGTIGDQRFPEGYNPGLKKHKEELGCTAYTQQFYKFDL